MDYQNIPEYYGDIEDEYDSTFSRNIINRDVQNNDKRKLNAFRSVSLKLNDILSKNNGHLSEGIFNGKFEI